MLIYAISTFILQVQEVVCSYFFFFQAEDGIRDIGVTGVQTCALPISTRRSPPNTFSARSMPTSARRRSCRSPRSEERRVGKGVDLGGRGNIKKKKTHQ